jgi:SAM-dependent methyltransferase
MNTEDILKLNKDFYQSVASDFNKTRQSGWPGWKTLLPFIEKLGVDKTLSVADIACGNARFGKFLVENLSNKAINYHGFDSNEYLLKQGAENIPHGNFIQLDILQDYTQIIGNFDLIAVFGFMHHIPTDELRSGLIRHLSGQLSKGGLLAISLWQYNNLKTQNTKIGPSDYIDTWANSDHKRYVHTYTEDEIEKMTCQLTPEVETLGIFEADGRTENLNKYLLLRRKS